MSIEDADVQIQLMSKELRPTVEGVHMLIFSEEGELALLRGRKEHYFFEDIYFVRDGDPEYQKNHAGILFCKYRGVAISISKEKGKWVATVE